MTLWKLNYFLIHSKTEPSAISQHANNLCNNYSEYLEQECLVEEGLHVHSYLISSSVEQTSVLAMSRMIRGESIYPNAIYSASEEQEGLTQVTDVTDSIANVVNLSHFFVIC